MSHSAWPVAADITAIASTIPGIDLSGFNDAAKLVAVAEAVSYAEYLTDWTPLLAPGTAAARLFGFKDNLDGMNNLVLPLPPRDDAVILTDWDPVESTGTATEIYTDWWPHDRVVNILSFRSCPTIGPNSIKITQKWGRFIDDIPDDLWGAVRDYAVAILMGRSVGSVGAATKIKEDTVSIEYGNVSSSSLVYAGGPVAHQFGKTLETLCYRYRRVAH